MNQTAVAYRVRHTTTYDYDRQVSLSHHQAFLLPRDEPGQRVLVADLFVDPLASDRREHRDAFGNRVTYFSIDQPHLRLSVTATSEVEIDAAERPGLDTDDQPWELVRDRLLTDETEAGLVSQYAIASPLVPVSDALAEYAAPSFPPRGGVVAGVLDLTHRIFEEFAFEPGVTGPATPVDEVLYQQRGVCQDFAHLAIGCLRSIGLAAGYVSGYLETSPPPGWVKLIGADASHAWLSAWVGDGVWLDLDPTNDQVPTDRHVVVARGRDYGDVPPVKGVIFAGGESHTLSVAVDVERISS